MAFEGGKPMNWQNQIFRLTVLTNDDAKGMTSKADAWWQLVNKQDAQNIRKQAASNLCVYDRVDNGLQYILQIMNGRVDWLIQSLGEYSQSPDLVLNESTVRRLYGKWLIDHCPTTNRIAIGAKFQADVPGLTEGYKALRQFAPIDETIPGICDFLYQVNIPMQSTSLPQQKLNRLSKWYVELATSIIVSSQGIQQSSVNSYRATLETDFNNIGGSNLSPEERLKLVIELAKISTDVASRGLNEFSYSTSKA